MSSVEISLKEKNFYKHQAHCCPTKFASSTCNEFDECEAEFEQAELSDVGVAVAAAAVVPAEAFVAACCRCIQALDIVRRYIAEAREILEMRALSNNRLFN